MRELKTKQQLIDDVVSQITKDINDGYLEGLEELLNFVPSENLAAYLPEELRDAYSLMIGREYEEKERDEFLKNRME